MDFFERIFGISPDNGDGSTEFLWVVAVIAVVAAVFIWRRRRAPAKSVRRDRP